MRGLIRQCNLYQSCALGKHLTVCESQSKGIVGTCWPNNLSMRDSDLDIISPVQSNVIKVRHPGGGLGAGASHLLP